MATYPVFSVGEVLTADDMNAVGLWKITPTVTSVGGTAATVSNGVITIGNGNTSVTISSAFSADTANYLIMFDSVKISSGNSSVLMKMGTTATGYYGALVYYAYDTSGDGVIKRNNSTEWSIGYAGTNNFGAAINVYAPQLAVRTTITGNYGGDLYYGTVSSMLANTTQYTSFNLAVPGGVSFTGGTIRVYGYRD